MFFTRCLLFSRASLVVMSLYKTDSVVTVEDSTNTPVATGLQAFESKLTSLADSVVKMFDSLPRFTQPAMSVLSADDEMTLLEEDRLSPG